MLVTHHRRLEQVAVGLQQIHLRPDLLGLQTGLLRESERVVHTQQSGVATAGDRTHSGVPPRPQLRRGEHVHLIVDAALSSQGADGRNQRTKRHFRIRRDSKLRRHQLLTGHRMLPGHQRTRQVMLLDSQLRTGGEALDTERGQAPSDPPQRPLPAIGPVGEPCVRTTPVPAVLADTKPVVDLRGRPTIDRRHISHPRVPPNARHTPRNLWRFHRPRRKPTPRSFSGIPLGIPYR